MKKYFLPFLFLLFLGHTSWAQSPQKFNYQGVARNATGAPLVNTIIGLRLTITDGFMAPLYTETFLPGTNALGLFTVEVGGGTPVSGTFNSIDWLDGLKYLKVEMDITGGTSYTDMGASQFLSVPYALVAHKADQMNLEDLQNVVTPGIIPGQVLTWNGTHWVPGDDAWGNQVAASTGAITGDGTAINPLNLASQGASTGQVLQWNGTAWVPASITAGDNWGTETVHTNTAFTGNGTLANPLALSQQGAMAGQVLEWNDTSWVPRPDDLTLPYNKTAAGASALFKITNTMQAPAIMGVCSDTSLAFGNSAMYGRNNSHEGGSYGVHGIHMGEGIGVFGEAYGQYSSGLMGYSWGPSGSGVSGVALDTVSGMGVIGKGGRGVVGYGIGSSSIGLSGISLNNGMAGGFLGSVIIEKSGSLGFPHLDISNPYAIDGTKIRMRNSSSNNNYWELYAYNSPTPSLEYFRINNGASGTLMHITGNGNVGIGTTGPAERLHVNGNIAFTGALMPNNQPGTSGQVLVSSGPGAPPTWKSSTNEVYANLNFSTQTSVLNLTNSPQLVPGLGNTGFVISRPSKVIFSFHHPYIINNLSGGSNSDVVVQVEIYNSSNVLVMSENIYQVVAEGNNESIAYSMYRNMSTNGSYYAVIKAYVLFGDTDVSLIANKGQCTVQVIPQ